MFAVGAVDAYFSDAYADIVTATALSKQRQKNITLPDPIQDIRVPIRAVLETYDARDWRWRMAARELVDTKNFLSLEAIQKAFNPFLLDHDKFFGDTIEPWMQHPEATIRLFGMSAVDYSALEPAAQVEKKKTIVKPQFLERFKDIFQRRHDCIHNCDRPRLKPQPLTRASTVEKVVKDAEFLVHRCDEHIVEKFPAFLRKCGATSTTINGVGY